MYYIFDGAMGTMLQKAGMKDGYCPELCNAEHPETVKEIHKEYLQAGSMIITTNTFGACRLKLEDYHLEDRTQELNIQAVKLAKQAIAETEGASQAKVAGSMGPTGKFIAPLGQISFDEVYENYREQAADLIQGGADYILIETIIDIQEMRAAFLGAKDAREASDRKSEVKIICQFSFSEDGRTITGTTPAAAAILMEAMGADIIGINCSLGPEQLIPLIKEMAAVTDLPLSIQPNAGMPTLINGETIFPLTPEEMGHFVPQLLDAGATYLGACCGSTPAHIKAIRAAAAGYTPAERLPIKPFTALTSRTRIVRIGRSEPPVIIGERINPTGRKVLAKELQEGRFIMVKKDALAQVDAGAHILDVNMGVPGADPAPLMEKAITELSMLVEVPLSIDTLDSAALEAGLKAYPGRPLINSVNAEPEQLEAVLPLARRYGAALLCLPISSGDLPQTAEARCTLAKKIVLEAFKYGLRPQDLLLDPLVLTLAAGNDSALETLRTLDIYQETFGFPTVMGLSNVSFGLPQRPYLNAQFLTMALSHGLSAPILNPLNYTVKKAFTSTRTLLGHDPAAREFISSYGNESEEAAQLGAGISVASSGGQATGGRQSGTGSADGSIQGSASSPSAPAYADDPVGAIRTAVEQGEKELVVELVEHALADHIDPLSITKNGLSEAMNIIGEKFGSGKAFLPQVMLAAESMQAAFQTIKRVLPSQAALEKGTIVLATVKGDIHDLGKNIVAALLENSGYKIIDLGKDVDPQTIVDATLANKAPIVGICSLMTTTMPQIDNTITALRHAGIPVKVIVGGAVLTQDYADRAGADKYARDGITAVKLVNELLDNE